jgi:RNA polymerase sigma-70 factor (ECF subfamily)
VISDVDDAVVRKAQRGDQRAFALIVESYEIPVFNYVRRLVNDRTLAEDLTQEVFLRVYLSLPRFSFRAKFTTWLFQVAKNRVVDELRAQERRPRPANLAAERLHALDPPAERAEMVDALWRAIDRLDLDLKLAILLRDVAGFSYSEIGEILEITLPTVKWRIYKAREGVQLALARQGLTPASDADDEQATATG